MERLEQHVVRVVIHVILNRRIMSNTRHRAELLAQVHALL